MTMKYFFMILLVSSCAVKMKKDQPKLVSVTEIKFQKPKNWADGFYRDTIFKIKNPKVMGDYKLLDTICKGADMDYVSHYQAVEPYPIKYKKNPVVIQTEDGFSKKVYVSKGVCRELTLLKAPKTSKEGNIRINIKEMNIDYIYNFGSFVRDITFRTAFKDVEFYVK